MVTNLTYLGSLGLGILLVAVGTFLGFSDADLDHDGDADFDGHVDGDVGSGLSLLSMAGIGSLLVGFGAGGYTASFLGLGPLLAVPFGLAGAWGGFRLTARVRRTLIRSLETGDSAGEQDLVFQPATVTIPIPARLAGRGQVMVSKGGRTFYVSARSEADQELPVGDQVVITAVGDGVFLVEEYEGNRQNGL